MKILSLIIFSVLLFLASSTHADKPYKAITVDECIQEKECVWFAFEKLLLGSTQAPNERQYWIFKRWEKAPSIQIMDGDIYEDRIREVVAQINPHLPFDIQVNGEKINTFFVFADDIEEAFFKKHYDYFKSIFVTKMPLLEGLYRRNIEKSYCKLTKLHNKQKELMASVSLLETDSQYFDECLVSNVYGLLSQKKSRLNMPFDWDKGPPVVQKEITDMDLFLLRVLYHPKFRSGMTFEQVSQQFDVVYKETLVEFVK